MTKLTHPIRLSLESAKDWWRWKRLLLPIVLVVAVPAMLVYFVTGDTEPTLSAYTAFATLFMNTAVIWSVQQLAAGKKVTIKAAYYQGTAMAVRLILLSGLYFLMAVPFLIGALIYLNGVLGETPVSGLGENLLLLAVWLLLALPSLYWLSRSIFGIFSLADGNGPLESARASRALVHGRILPAGGRLGWLLLLLLLMVTLPSYVILNTFSDSAYIYASGLLQLLSGLLVVPFSYLYLHRLYANLKAVKATLPTGQAGKEA